MTAPTFLPLSTPIQHVIWQPSVDVNGNPVKDSHGNQTGSFSAPITRMIVCWWPLERRTWQVDPIDPDVVARIESDIHLMVPDSSIYKKLDRVIVDVNGVPAWYQVEGLPIQWSSALPFPAASYGMLIGGEVHCRRITSTGVLAGQ